MKIIQRKDEISNDFKLDHYKNQTKKSKITKITSERASIISQFVDKLNEARRNTKYKPILPQVIAIKLSHLTLQELYWFYSVCKESRSFGATFWSKLKL